MRPTSRPPRRASLYERTKKPRLANGIARRFCRRWIGRRASRSSSSRYGLRLRRRIFSLGRVVNFKLQIEMLVLREDVRQIWHQFGLIADQWIGGLVFSVGRNAQAAEHHRTVAQRDFSQISNLNIGFKRANPPRAIFANHKLQMTTARRQLNASAV